MIDIEKTPIDELYTRVEFLRSLSDVNEIVNSGQITNYQSQIKEELKNKINEELKEIFKKYKELK